MQARVWLARDRSSYNHFKFDCTYGRAIIKKAEASRAQFCGLLPPRKSEAQYIFSQYIDTLIGTFG